MAAEQPIPPAPAGMTVIPNVSLEEFERAVYAREHDHACRLLLQNLQRFKAGGQFIGYGSQPELVNLLYTRFCAAVIALLADPQFHLSQQGFDMLAAEHAVMDMLFRASAFRTSDHLLALTAKNPEAGAQKLEMPDGGALVKYLMTYSLVSGFELNFAQTFKRNPQAILSLYAGMLSPLLTADKTAHDRREALLGLHKVFEHVELTEAVLPTISDAYMYTSYGTRRDKHAAKATIHKLMARILSKVGIPEVKPSKWKDRPTILIALDWFNSNHAMFRCYAPIIRQLRKRFRLIGMCAPGSIDELAKAEFDEWYPVEIQGLVLENLMKRIAALAPDIIYYPSVGMSLWWVALASVRLAPVQCITLGHPASTRSEAIDYVLCEESAIGDRSLFSETVVTYPDGHARYVMRPDADLPQPRRDEGTPAVIHVAVPSMLCKVGAPFMAACRRIQQEAGRPVQFHFFINMLGVQLHQAAKEIREWVPGALIYERRHYNEYMRELRECHLHLSTFPFGGTNSNIDSMLLGIPIVTLWGDEPHQRFDGMMIRRAGLPESLITHSVDEYVAEACRLIRDDSARELLRDHLLAFDLQSEFYGDPPDTDAFLKAMESIYERHFTRPGSLPVADAGDAPDGGGRGGSGPGDGLVSAAGQADRAGPDADGLGEHRGVPEEVRP